MKEARFVDIGALWKNPVRHGITFVDVFSGCGGLSSGMCKAGFKCLCGLDFFKDAADTFTLNLNAEVVVGDVVKKSVKDEFCDLVQAKLNGSELGVVCGGFPCQGFSLDGKRDLLDERNRLYYEMLKLVEVLKPKFVVCENVKGIRSMDFGRTVEKIVADYASIGYKMDYTTLNAANYYVPQLRERVLFIGNRIGAENLFPMPLVDSSGFVTVGDAIGDLQEQCESEEFNFVPVRHRADVVERLKKLSSGSRLYGYGSSWRRLYDNKPSWTVKENHGCSFVHPTLPRTLTVREMARLQSFDDSFRFCGTKTNQFIQVGNAVPPLLGKAVGLAVMKSFSGGNGNG